MPHTNSKNRLLRNSKKSTSKSTSRSQRSHRPQVALFDENDRYNYLTGFSSRKKAAKVAAQERANERARNEKLEFRRQLKEARLSKIKETIEQQAEWYKVDAFAELEEYHKDNPTPSNKVESVMKTSFHDENNQDMNMTTTTVTIEPLEVDHTVLMTSKKKESRLQQVQNSSHPNRNSNQFNNNNNTSSSIKLDPHQSLKNRKKKSDHKIKKKKIPYESRATKSIERQKKKIKRDSKSKKKR